MRRIAETSRPVKRDLGRAADFAPRGGRNLSAPPSAADLLALARRRFLACQHISIEELAAELGVSRATAYRWVGNAEQLAGLVVAGIVDDTFARTLREGRGQGEERIVDVTARGLRYVATSEPYRAFLARDPQKALRIVASKEGPVQVRTIAHHEALLREEIERGNLTLPVDPHTMAYALVRIAESFLYADIIAGEEIDLDKAMEIIKLMLRGAS
jgi:AcrR family transcriptional regulator